jgi:hypothetical protein
MKILYIYKDYKQRRKQYGKIMQKLGHDVSFLEIKKKKEKNQLSVKDIKKYNIDVVWFYSPFYIRYNKEAIEYIRKKKIPIVLYGQYNPQIPYDEWIDVWKKVDVLFVQNNEFNRYLRKNNLNSYYVPFGFHPDQYYKTIKNKKYDISFCGTSLHRDSKKNDKRAKYIRSLKKYDIHVFGESFINRVGSINVKSYKTHSHQRKIYGQTKINLDLPFFHKKPLFYKDKYHIKNRLFEVPSTHNFLLTVRCEEFLNIFGEDLIGYYDDNVESLEEMVKKYLKDKNIRERMTAKAYKYVYEKHTFTHRFKEMFLILKKDLNME